MSVNRILGVVLMGLATYAQAQDNVPAGVKEECAQLPAVTQQGAADVLAAVSIVYMGGINYEHGRACPSVFHFSRAVVAIL